MLRVVKSHLLISVLSLLICILGVCNAAAEHTTVPLSGSKWKLEGGSTIIDFWDEDNFTISGEGQETIRGDYYIDGDQVAFVVNRGTIDMRRTFATLDGNKMYHYSERTYTFVLQGPAIVLEEMHQAFRTYDIEALLDVFDPSNPDVIEIRSLLKIPEVVDSIIGLMDIFDLMGNLKKAEFFNEAAEFFNENVLSEVFSPDSLLEILPRPNLMYVIHNEEVNGDSGELLVSFYMSFYTGSEDDAYLFENPVLIETVRKNGKWKIKDVQPAPMVNIDVHDMIGTWEFSSLVAGCTEVTSEIIQYFPAEYRIALQLSLVEDGTFEMRMATGGELLVENGSWSNEGGTLWVDDGMYCFMQGDDLVIMFTGAGFAVKCERVDKTDPLWRYKKYRWGDYWYTINENNEATIIDYQGTGLQEGKRIEIPSEVAVHRVTAYGRHAFSNPDNAFEEVCVGEGIKEIGSYAFAECFNLKRVILPNTVEAIGMAAFCDCYNLESIILPEGLVSIDHLAFLGCRNLREITIPASVTYIDGAAFDRWSNITVVVTPGSYAEHYCKDNGITYEYPTVPIVITEDDLIGTAWQSNGVQFVFLPNGTYNAELVEAHITVNMPYKWDNGILKLTSDMIVDYYGEDDWCVSPNTTPIELIYSIDGDSLNSTYDGYTEVLQFAGRLTQEELEDALIAQEAALLAKDYEFRVLDDGTLAITLYAGSEQEVSIPEKLYGRIVSQIDADAFFRSYDVTRIIIPDNVISIDACAFAQCENLSIIVVPASVSYIGDWAFPGDTVIVPPGSYAEKYCIENRQKYISLDQPFITDDYVCGVLTNNSIEIGMYIGGDHEVSIPAEIDGMYVTRIGESAFANCSDLTGVVVPEKVTSIGAGAFKGCTNLSGINIPCNVTEIGSSAFAECSSLTSITIPEGITCIGDSTFYNCYTLNSVVLPTSVTYIGISAFGSCHSLTSITIPEGVTSIGRAAFASCSHLTSIEIPQGIHRIENSTFSRCSRLERVDIPESVIFIGNDAFRGCESLTEITLPDSLTEIGEMCFAFCQALTHVAIPDSVTSIGNRAFMSCSNLTSVIIPKSVTSIGEKAFGIKNLVCVVSPGSYAEQYCKENELPYTYAE